MIIDVYFFRLETRQGCQLSVLLFYTKTLAIRQNNKKKANGLERKM